MKELTVKLKSEITDEQLNKLNDFLFTNFNTDEFIITTEDYVEPNKPEWVSLKDLIKIIKDKDLWSMDTKYLNLYLDTRFIENDFHCTVKTRNGKQYLSLKDLEERRRTL